MISALHLVAGLPSIDLGNCYDAVSHPIASIAIQALKVPLMTVILALSVLQTMTFYLRTGYGVGHSKVMVAAPTIPLLALAKEMVWLCLASRPLACS
jgi:hypothetical protein